MILWLILAVMTVVAAAGVSLPLVRDSSKRLPLGIGLAVLFALSLGVLYPRLGRPELASLVAPARQAADAPPQDPDRLLLDEWLVAHGVVGVDGDQAVLGLGHDLLGDDEDVAVEKGALGVGGDCHRDVLGDVVAGVDLADALQPEDGQTAHALVPAASTARASDAASSGVRMTVGVTTQRIPSASTAGASAASASSMTSVPANSR